MPLPTPISSSRAITRALASSTDRPSRKPELTITPSSTNGAFTTSNAFGSASRGITTGRIGRPYLVANSWSRSSWPGQPKIAPVPYSISTKLAA